MRLKPPFPYLGSKSRLAPKIIDLLPDHTHYVEPYAGSLSVLLAKPRSVAETINDRDGSIANLWRVIRDHPAELEQAMRLTPHSHEEYYAAVAEPKSDDPVEWARRTLTKLWQGTTRTTQHGGMWAKYVTYQPRSISFPEQMARMADRVQPVADRLSGVSIDQRDALKMIQKYGRSKSTLLYLDPPYLPRTRSGSSYPYDMTEEDHENLLDVITGIPAKVILSGYRSSLYDAALEDWERHEYPAFAGGRGTPMAKRTETVWVKPCHS